MKMKQCSEETAAPKQTVQSSKGHQFVIVCIHNNSIPWDRNECTSIVHDLPCEEGSK